MMVADGQQVLRSGLFGMHGLVDRESVQQREEEFGFQLDGLHWRLRKQWSDPLLAGSAQQVVGLMTQFPQLRFDQG